MLGVGKTGSRKIRQAPGDSSLLLFSPSARLTLCDPVDCSTPGFPVLHYLPQSAQTQVGWVGDAINHLIFCCPLLLLPSVFPSVRVFSGELVLPIRWPKYCSFNFNISPSNEYSGLISFRIDWLDLLAVFSSTTILKHQFFGTQPSLWSNSHICIWLLERLWLYGPLSAKGCFCFLICCLGLS